MGWVADVVDKANEILKEDRQAAIGPSYFMKEDLNEEDVRRIWEHSVIPYIESAYSVLTLRLMLSSWTS